jgi:serine/threonine protein kinase
MYKKKKLNIIFIIILMINNKYKIEKFISRGSFGSVYECSFNNKKYAVKSNNDSKILKYEATIYAHLRSIKNISSLVDFFLFDNNFYMVLDLYKLNLKDFKTNYFKSRNYNERLKIMIDKIVETIRYIHNIGVVHRDLKPTNICINSNLEPYIVDFGMAKKIIHNKKHIDEKNINGIIGSPNYISKNVLNLIEPTRRDDTEAVIYIVLYMLLDEAEYMIYTNNTLYIQKQISTIEQLILNNNINENLLVALKYIRKLNYKQQPNYDYISGLLLL